MESVLKAAREIELSDADTRERLLGYAVLLTDVDADGFPRMELRDIERCERMVELLDHVGFFDAPLPAPGATP
jgi:hypothetical protein